MPIDIWELAVEVRTEWTDGRKDEEALEVILIKSRGTHLAGGEKITN